MEVASSRISLLWGGKGIFLDRQEFYHVIRDICTDEGRTALPDQFDKWCNDTFDRLTATSAHRPSYSDSSRSSSIVSATTLGPALISFDSLWDSLSSDPVFVSSTKKDASGLPLYLQTAISSGAYDLQDHGRLSIDDLVGRVFTRYASKTGHMTFSCFKEFIDHYLFVYGDGIAIENADQIWWQCFALDQTDYIDETDFRVIFEDDGVLAPLIGEQWMTRQALEWMLNPSDGDQIDVVDQGRQMKRIDSVDILPVLRSQKGSRGRKRRCCCF